MKQCFRAAAVWGGVVRICFLLPFLLQVPCIAATGKPTRIEIVAESRDMKSSIAAVTEDLKSVEDIAVVPLNDKVAAALPDVFVIARTTQTVDGAQHSLTVFDSATTERLQDVELPGVVGQVLNEAITDAIRKAIDRQRHARKATHFISILSVRNVDLGTDNDRQVQQIKEGVERELFGDSSLTLLERSQLALINESVAEQNNLPVAKVIGASTVIEIDVAKALGISSNQVQATVTLSAAAGVRQGQVTASGSSDDVPSLVHVLADKTRQTISSLPPATRGPLADHDEAGRFANESDANFARRHWDEAVVAADAAKALAPSDKNYRTQLTNALSFAGVRSMSFDPADNMLIVDIRPADLDWDRTLHILLRASNLLVHSGNDPVALAKLADSQTMLHHFVIAMLESPLPSNPNVHQLARLDEHGNFHSTKVPLSTEQTRLLSQIIWNERNYLRKVVLPRLLAAVQDNPSFEAYTTKLMESIGDDCHLFCRTSSEYVASATQQLIDWAPLAGRYASPRMEVYGLSWMNFDSAPGIWVENFHDWERGWRPPCFGPVTPDQARQWEKVANALEQAGAPMRLYINLRNWARDVEHPAAQIAVAPSARVVHHRPVPQPTPPVQPVPEGPLPLLYSKSVAMIDSQAGQVDPYCIDMPLVIGDELYVVVLGDCANGGEELRLMRGPIDASAPLQVLCRLPDIPDSFVKSCRLDGNSFFQMKRFLGSGHLILSSDTGLIFVLSLDHGGAGIIDAQKELPGSILQAAADVGDNIYMMVSDRQGATCLVCYDLHSQRSQTLSSSARANAIAPFDDIAPASSSYIWSDPDHDRIVFFAYQSTWDAATKGLWEFSAKTGKFRKLQPTDYSRKEGAGGYELTGTPVVDHKFALMTGTTMIYDLMKDAPSDVTPGPILQFQARLELPKIFESWWKRYGDPGGTGVGSGDNTIQRRAGNIHALSEIYQAYPMFSIDVPPAQVLVADWSGMWLLTPN